MNTTYHTFKQGLRWNTLEGIWYQVALAVHNIFLFNVIGQAQYGLVGTVFSVLYLLITLINFGLDSSLGPFFTALCQSKQACKRILAPQLVPEFLFFIITACSLYLITPLIAVRFPSFGSVEPFLLPCLGILIICEGIKKTFRTILQLAFWNQVTTTIEIATISCYISFVWFLYGLGYKISLITLFLPMLLTSVISSLVLAWYVHAWYLTLPESNQPTEYLSLWWRIIKSRFFTYIIQLGHVFFSGNFLVPFFALHFGLEQAGVFKLMCSIAYALTIILQKIFGLSTEALFAHVKDMHIETKRSAFKIITRHLFPLLYIILLFMCINGKKIALLNSTPNLTVSAILIVLFFVTHFSEHFFMVYEKFFIVEEKAHYLAAFHVVMISLIYGTFWWTASLSPLITLTSILFIRILAFACISTASFFLWQITPAWRIHSSYIITSATASLVFFLL